MARVRLGLEVGLGGRLLLIADCQYAIRGIECRLPVPDTRPISKSVNYALPIDLLTYFTLLFIYG